MFLTLMHQETISRIVWKNDDRISKSLDRDIVHHHGCTFARLAFDPRFSEFQTLGVSNKRYLDVLNGTGLAFSIIVCLAFAMMPVSVYLGWIRVTRGMTDVRVRANAGFAI
jgi:hypothetical protein